MKIYNDNDAQKTFIKQPLKNQGQLLILHAERLKVNITQFIPFIWNWLMRRCVYIMKH